MLFSLKPGDLRPETWGLRSRAQGQPAQARCGHRSAAGVHIGAAEARNQEERRREAGRVPEGPGVTLGRCHLSWGGRAHMGLAGLEGSVGTSTCRRPARLHVATICSLIFGFYGLVFIFFFIT